MAERAGFKAAFLNIDEGTTSVSKFSFPRVHVTADMSLTDLEARISGFHRSLRRIIRISKAERCGVKRVITETSSAEKEPANLRTYGIPQVASYYAALNYLTPCEKLLFQSYIKPGMESSTSVWAEEGPQLIFPGLRHATSESIIRKRWCRHVGKSFLHLDFRLADASICRRSKRNRLTLSSSPSTESIPLFQMKKGLRCLSECWRVLRPKGVFIFLRTIRALFWFGRAWDPDD